MPYRRVGTTVEVKKGVNWETVKKHPSVRLAEKHLMALRINVEGKGGHEK